MRAIINPATRKHVPGNICCDAFGHMFDADRSDETATTQQNTPLHS
jgi:hypothetical protein